MIKRQRHRVFSARDVPPAVVLLICVVAIAGLSWLVGPYRYSSGESPAKQGKRAGAAEKAHVPELNEFNFDKRYAGEIITGSIDKNECRKIIFNNSNGHMWDKGAVDCDDFTMQGRASDKQSVHLREISKAFRHGEPAIAAPASRRVEAR